MLTNQATFASTHYREYLVVHPGSLLVPQTSTSTYRSHSFAVSAPVTRNSSPLSAHWPSFLLSGTWYLSCRRVSPTKSRFHFYNCNILM